MPSRGVAEMPNNPEENDIKEWHLYFAIECNNRAWDLSIQARNHAEDLEMLNAAHASALHWKAMGKELNNMRATMLLAEVHALLGNGTTAFLYAQGMREYFLGIETPDWELAFVHTIYAHAAFAAGESSVHKSAYETAIKAIQAIKDDQDREIVQKTFEGVPRPR